jgi:hypothetical protein
MRSVVPADIVERALEDVSDGNRVDWNLLLDGARDDDEREQLKWLRVLGDIVALQQSVNESISEDSLTLDRASADSESPERVPSANWGRYQLLEKVGEGGFGSVHLAWDPQLESELAIKILHSVATDERLKARLLREGRALAKVSHPNVVKVLNVEAHEGRIGLCMEFVRGQTLDELLRTRGRLTVDDALAISRDVCNALAAVHGAGFVHRDVKARNVIREDTGRIVLMDFGAGREVVSELSATRSDMTGTPLYMAPEVLGGSLATTRSDVYSVGVLLFYLVTGEYPVHAETLAALLTAHRSGGRRSVRERRPEVPRQFARIIERALAADPRDRYADGGALAAAVELLIRRKERTIASRLLTLAYNAVLIAVLVTMLGGLSTGEFNEVLGRYEFSSETMWDWLVWGVKSTLLPAFLLMWAAGGTSLVVALRRLSISRSAVAANLDRDVRRWAAELVGRRPSEVCSASSGVLLAVSVGILAGGWWYFWWLMTAFMGTVSTSPAALLSALAPDRASDHDLFRTTFSSIVFVLCTGWYGLVKFAGREGQRVNRNMLAGGVAVIVLALGTVDLPYRLLRHNDFEVAAWNGQRCYILGERTKDLLLFCPELPAPRNRVVERNMQSVQRSGVFENIFTRFSGVAASMANAPAPSTTR